MNKHIKLFFLFILLNSILWISLVPLWQFPDEQGHFGQVAHIGETGKDVDYKAKNNLTKEIYISEILLGTFRDNSGNNKFTFHPEYKIPYSNSFIGIYEANISDLASGNARSELVWKEATRYPVLYYLPGAIFYKLFYSQDLFVRVYAVRFWSVLLFTGTVFITYLLSRLLFAKNRLLQITLTLLVGFQPMMVFANTGVNSDALGNLLFTLFLYIGTRMIVKGMTLRSLIGLIITVGVAVYTKPQFILSVPLSCLLIAGLMLRDLKHKNKIYTVGGFIVFSLIIICLLNLLEIGPIGAFRQFFARFDLWSLVKFTREYTLSHTYSEVLPWYWGIYDWLGVTYPRIVHRIINWTILLSIIGLIKFVFQAVRYRKLRSRNFQAGLFLVFVSAVYFVSISFYDWLSWYTQGYQLGVQGRYLFPVISVHMLLLLIGWRELFSWKKKITDAGIKLLGSLMILLNFFALYTVAKTYYDLSSFSIFTTQASQYKPWFVKGPGLIAVIACTIITLVFFLIEYIRYPNEKNSFSKK